MKKYVALALTLVLALGLLAGCGSTSSSTAAPNATGDTELNLYTWAGMFPQEVLDGFTAETGITVNYSNFDYDETMLTKLEEAKGGDYDVIIADDYIIETAISEGLVQPLDKSKISNIENVNPIYMGQFYDATNEYTVPYGAGVQTIVYNPANVDIDITGYADLWDASLKDSVGVIGNYRVINGMALKVMGESYNTDDTAVINAAGEKLLELAPNIRLIKDDDLQDDLLSGEINAAVMYTSQVTMAMLQDSSLKVVFPKEGVGLGIMAQFIPANAPHADAAHQFINYLLQPEVSAQCFEYLGYYCTNLAAEEYINEDYRAFLTLPESVTPNDTEMIQNISADADAAHTLVWTQFKSACGQ